MSNKKKKNKRKKGLPKKNTKRELKKIREKTVETVNPTVVPTIPTIVKNEEEPVNPTSIPIIEEKQDSYLLPPVNPMGVPGVLPIPNSGINHNVMRQPGYLFQNKSKKKKKNWLLVIVFPFLLVIIFLLVYLLLFRKEKHLVCTFKEYEEEEKYENVSVLTYEFKKDRLVKTIDEESIVLNEDSMNLYSTFEESLKSWVEEEKNTYHNVHAEIQNTENTIKVIYTVDLTADPKDPKNDLEELGYSYEELKEELEGEGYYCK